MTEKSAPANIFLSYARENKPFTDDLVISLKSHGFNPLRDLEELAAGEAWQTRLTDMVKQADTLVFVASPLSLASPACERELDIAFELGKRVIPIVVDGANFDEIPERLRKLQFIVFGQDGCSYAQDISNLVKALREDIRWVREHARLTSEARRWDERNRSDGALLHGQALKDALEWRAQTTPKHMDVADVVEDYLARSRIVERKSRVRNVIGAAAVTVLVVVVLVSAVAIRNISKARDEANAARDRAIEAENQKSLELQASDAAAVELRNTIAELEERLASMGGPTAARRAFSIAELEPYITNLTSDNPALRRNSRRDIGGLLKRLSDGELNRAVISRLRRAADQDVNNAYRYRTGAAVAISQLGPSQPPMTDRDGALADLAAMCNSDGADPTLRGHFSAAIAVVSGRPQQAGSCAIPN